MTVKTHTIEPVDSLSLLSLKVASNVFDVSSGVHHLSIRDQIVRARMLVRDLKQGDKALSRILIVGAGVAGMSAALTACELGIEHVLIVEAKSEPFALLRNITARHVGPFMYEWPSPFFDNQSYPEEESRPWLGEYSSPLSWQSKSPLSAHELAQAMEKDLLKRYAAAQTRLPKIFVNIDTWSIKEFVKRFAKREAANSLMRLQRRSPMKTEKICFEANSWPQLDANGKKIPINLSKRTQHDFHPQYVILAAGMGQENIELTPNKPSFKGISFWKNDSLLHAPAAARRVAIFGGGDGALQDVLRTLTGHEHPLKFVRHLEGTQAVKRALRKVTPLLLSVERQSRQFSGWTKGQAGFAAVDEHCRRIANRLAKDIHVVRRVLQAIRLSTNITEHGDKAEVALFVRESYFDKAYLLNRFLVHLIDACLTAQQRPASAKSVAKRITPLSLKIFWAHQAIASVSAGGRYTITVENLKTKVQLPYIADLIVVRYGVMKDSVPGHQMIQISPKTSAQRTTLCRVELPFAAPSNT